MTIDLGRICRLCLENGHSYQLIDIFTNDLSMRIMACSGLEIIEDDALPQNICTECRYCMEKCYLFRKKSKSADLKLRRHLKSINAGNVLEEDDDDEYEEAKAFFAKWEDDNVVKQTIDEGKYQSLRNQWNLEKKQWESEKHQLELDIIGWQKKVEELENLKRAEEEECQRILGQLQVQAFEVDNNFQGLINENELNQEDHKLMNESESPKSECEEYSTTLTVLDSAATENYGSFEIITDEESNFSSMFDEEESEISDIIQRDQTNYVLSGNDDEIEILYTEAEAESDNLKEDDEDYSNTEYLGTDGADVKEDEEVIPLDYSSMTKVIRNTIASCTGILPDREGVQCRVFKKNGKSTRIAVTTIDEPEKTHYIGIQQNRNYADNRKRYIDKIKHKDRGHCCEYCSKSFPCRSKLLCHVRIHTGETPFRCEECGKTFVQKGSLRRHSMVHTGERPHQCTFCEKDFVQIERLRQHINREHSKNPIMNLYQCQQCPKAFQHATGLSRHSFVHTGRKFECEFCSRPFTDQSAMRRHVARLHTNILEGHINKKNKSKGKTKSKKILFKSQWKCTKMSTNEQKFE